ncbi:MULTISPECIES: hypothetical protein [unclassified Luteococcus]|uniref:hypothetical protein n=1 Tax=unclassified Luteococcus TaxID=2639923 RepID=UPI00313E6F9D
MPNLFSESTFALAYSMEWLDELRRTKQLLGLPVVPSLQEEAALGYDLKVPTPWALVFLQFKVSAHLTANNAYEIRQGWRRPGEAYFRFMVKTGQTANGKVQHNTLCDLANAPGVLVRYAAPIFSTSKELYGHLVHRSVMSSSLLACPTDLGRVVQDSRHSYTYTGPHDVLCHSEPKPVPRTTPEEMIEDVERTLAESPPASGAEFVDRVAKRIAPEFRDTELVDYVKGPHRRQTPSPLEAKLFEPEYFEERKPQFAQWQAATEAEFAEEGRGNPRHRRQPRPRTPMQLLAHAGSQTGAIPFMVRRM